MAFDLVSVAQFGAVIVGFVGALTAIGVIAHAVVERTNLRVRARPQPLEDDRLHRLEQAVDAIAVEVERISEAQRFTAKLLAERSRDAP